MAIPGAEEKLEGETEGTLRVCRDHWKESFEHERRNVIRLRGLLYQSHVLQFGPGGCHCGDCDLVRAHRREKEKAREHHHGR